jgi:hypothetical protein
VLIDQQHIVFDRSHRHRLRDGAGYVNLIAARAQDPADQIAHRHQVVDNKDPPGRAGISHERHPSAHHRIDRETT